MELSWVASRLLADIFAEFAFLCCEPRAAAELPGILCDGWIARLEVQGLRRWEVALAVPRELAVELASNALGLEPGDPAAAARAREAVGEIAALLGGHLASTFPDVRLSPPEVGPLCPEAWAALRDDLRVQGYAVGGSCALLRMGMSS
jgi:hypothetical protein